MHSLAILEMLAAQLPIVSQPRGCLPELVTDGVNGFLAEEERGRGRASPAFSSRPSLRRDFGAASRDPGRDLLD